MKGHCGLFLNDVLLVVLALLAIFETAEPPYADAGVMFRSCHDISETQEDDQTHESAEIDENATDYNQIKAAIIAHNKNAEDACNHEGCPEQEF